MVVKRFEVWHVNLEPTVGSEINKIRPCLIISPDTTNQFLNTVTIAALTSTRKRFPTRVNCLFNAREGQVALDQIRSVDKRRLLNRIGELDVATAKEVCQKLQELFAY
ncbi:type II toxin-antitoxin system PemK/MazF family toxin [Spirosoma montaniterrae]|nr:type II toxin-antitoxin system PemK/MazF family toxin [Spirosoma montaniterrae]